MIVTVTPSPAIDWTIEVESFVLGAVNRIVQSVREPSGKGVNISWALHRAGLATRAVMLAGGAGGQLMEEALSAAGMEHVIVDTGREVRVNVTLITPGNSTKINEASSALADGHLREFRSAVISSSADASAVLVCGTLAAGVPAAFVRDMVRTLKDSAVDLDVVVDGSGDVLSLALEAQPDLIKPNVDELADFNGQAIATLGDVVVAAEQARAQGAGAVLASLGPDGALLVDEEGVLYGFATGIPFVNSVGAGDALLAGFFAGGRTREERLATAVLWASSAVAHTTTLFPIRQEFADQISVGEMTAPETPLSEPSSALSRPGP